MLRTYRVKNRVRPTPAINTTIFLSLLVNAQFLSISAAPSLTRSCYATAAWDLYMCHHQARGHQQCPLILEARRRNCRPPIIVLIGAPSME